MNIPGLRGLGPGELLKRSLSDFGEDEMSTYAAALAYHVLFSLFPFIIFLVALLGFLNIPEFFTWLRQQAEIILPAQAMGQVDSAIDQIQQPRGGLLSFGVIVALWTASAGVRAALSALNVAYDVPEGRPAWKLYPLSVLYTVGMAVMLVLATALMLIGPQAAQWLGDRLGVGQAATTLWNLLRWPLAVALLMLAVGLFYYLAPDVKQRFRFITPGSVLAVLVWIGASLGFGLYVQNFGNYSATYGGIGAVIVLLFYFYISSAILLYGAEINATIEHSAAEGKDPGEKEPDEKDPGKRAGATRRVTP